MSKITILSIEGGFRWWDAAGQHVYKGQLHFKANNEADVYGVSFGGLLSDGVAVSFGDPNGWLISNKKLKSPNTKARVIMIGFEDRSAGDLSRVQFTSEVSEERDHALAFNMALMKTKKDNNNK